MTENNERRERIIQNILNKETSCGARVGIYGAEVCQVCGDVGTFSGRLVAQMLHLTIDGSRAFVCFGCRTESRAGAPAGAYVSIEPGRILGYLQTRPYRYCEVCRTRVPATGDFRIVTPAGAKIWACDPCVETLRGNPDAYSPRRRYVDLEITTDERLRAFDMSLEAMRLDIEDIMDESLKAKRSERGAEVLARLGMIHGEKYGQ